jgi:predicted RNase H-like HicB family nuclease
MIDLKYSLVIEATEDPTFFGFYSPELEGFTGIGHSIEDCVYQATPTLIIQNQESLAQAS